MPLGRQGGSLGCIPRGKGGATHAAMGGATLEGKHVAMDAEMGAEMQPH